LLGRLSLNPLRHIDPDRHRAGPCVLLAHRCAGDRLGEARAGRDRALRNPRRAMVLVALAGPAANIAMAVFWCLVLRASCASTATRP
jgi:hypothetical protein